MKSTIFIKHTGRDLCKMPFPSLLRRQGPPEAQLQLFEHFGESQHAQTAEAVLRPGSCLRCAKAFDKDLKPSEKKSFRRPTCHAYDYAALIVPTAVCICIGMHAVKRRNRTHEIHNLHKTHRPRSLQNALSVAPAQAEPGPEAQLQLFEHFWPTCSNS